MDSERPHRTGTSSSSSSSSTTSELFICFTSRLSSSSSMKISSKSILSPGRTRDPLVSLSSSLSRRLRSNGSMKGGQSSPMFPTGSKKRGCAFENPEPSSPKVTCIGQVRVKTKKQGKKIRTTSKRLGEVSFRKIEQTHEGSSGSGTNHHNIQQQQQQQQSYQLRTNSHHQQQQQECLPHRNQRWVHLPLTICEALRAFGAEFSCLFPCRSSCFSSTGEREKEENKGLELGSGTGENEGSSSCGAVFARWLVALGESEGHDQGKGREIELVVGGDEEERRDRSTRNSRRVGDEIDEIKEEKYDQVKDHEVVEEDEEEEEGRVSICIPPKNALLLMRCRSDPLRMSALANRFWDSPVPQEEEDDDDEDDEEEEEDESNIIKEPQGNVDYQSCDEEGETICELLEETEQKVDEQVLCEKWVSTDESTNEEQKQEQYTPEEEEEAEEVLQINEEENPETNEVQEGDDDQQKQDHEVVLLVIDEDIVLCGSSSSSSSPDEVLVDPDQNLDMNEVNEPKLVQQEENEDDTDDEENERRTNSLSTSPVPVQSEQEQEQEQPEVEALEEVEAEKSTEEKETVTQERSDPVGLGPTRDQTHEGEADVDDEMKSKERERSVLPDCLLLMMCEPKLSMEVSKETWVCSTDFIRWLPEKQQVVNATDGGDELMMMKKKVSTDSNPAHPHNTGEQQQQHKQQQLHQLQPPRSSCSFPAAARGGAGVSMATMIEQKLVNAVAYEPFVLTRCKSEPMRTAASKLVPEACFWKNRKLEPHRPTTMGVGAAGIGF